MAQRSPASGRTPISAEKRAAVLEAWAAGKPRNTIVTETGVSAGSVSKIVAQAGGSFNRETTAAATAAVKADNASRRAKLLDGYYTEAEHRLALRQQAIWPSVFKGSFGVEEVHHLAFIPSRDWRDEKAAESHAMATIAKLEAVDNDGGVADERSLLAQLGEALGVAGPDA